MNENKKQRHIMTKQILGIFAVVLVVSVVAMVGTAAAKSVYLSANHHTSQFDAWNINPNGTVTYQTTYSLQHSTDPAGIAIDMNTTRIDPATGKPTTLMFISSEFSGGVEIVDPVTLTYIGVSSGPSNLAGIDVDDDDDILYALWRGTNRLYIFTYDSDGTNITQQTYITLPNLSYGYGLAFDDTRDILWVSDTGNGMVRAYNVNVTDWNNIAEIPSLSFTVSHPPIDVAVDMSRNLVYTVGSWAGSRLLSKYDVATGTETTIDMGVGGIGVAVEEITGYVYLTRGTSSSGDDIQVWDTSTSPFTLVQDTPRIGNPAGIAIASVSYNPLSLAKNDIIVGMGVSIGSEFTYEITCDNVQNPDEDAVNVTITDELPVELDFVSATHGGTYDPATHTVFWDIGTIPAGETGPLIELVVRVNQQATPGSTVYNYCTIRGTVGDQDTETTVTDDEGGDPEDDGTYIIPNQPPNVSDAYPSIDCLWPPNHKFVDITIEGVTDPDGDVVTITVTGITSDEPTASIKGAGGDKHAPDADPDCIGTAIARVRAERSGNEDGRVYEITFLASDGISEPVAGTVQVKVPHDQSGECVSIDSGQNYDATEINE